MKRRIQNTILSKRELSPPHISRPVSALSSPRTRSPSPASRPRTPVSYQVTGQGNQQLDVTEDSDGGAASEHHAGKGEGNKSPGIRYITESLIRHVSKQDNMAFLLSLNLSLAKDGGKKFKFIENLEKCERLQVLNLSNNLIEKIEKLDQQLKLQKLNLSHNKISKIEGIEHLVNLQDLNLAGNEIEHIPVWVGKKLRSLRNLNLKQNNISSLQDVARLKPLKDLTSLNMMANPVANLLHYRLFTIFHLRSLERLDGESITNHEREEAHNRFYLEEIERLEKDLENRKKEFDDLKEEHTFTLEELQHQDELNKSLKQETWQQKSSYKELKRELETKNELLKQKTVELTRACQKQYELEQELAFHKIDAKFEPLNYFPAENVEFEHAPDESPYIGKSRYKRNLYSTENYIPHGAQQIITGKIEPDEVDQSNNEVVRNKLHQALDMHLEDKEKNIQKAQERLEELQREIGKAEQQALIATAELKRLEDTVAQKKISEAEKEHLRQQLSQKIQLLNRLRQEAKALERQMEKQRAEIAKKQREIDELQRILDSIDPSDPRHVHVKAQKVSKEQQLDIMNKQYKQLESRLDEMLSRIAKETEDIKDLEQQLTEGQIAANEALKKDLEDIISGLQEYLESIKGQAKQAREECNELQREKEDLLHRLGELEEERNQLEIVAMDAENMREMENSALQAELKKERQALENAEVQAQLAAEKDQENKKLLAQLKGLQTSNNQLEEQLRKLQNQTGQAVEGMIRPQELTACFGDLRNRLKAGIFEIRPYSQTDTLGKNLAELQKQLNELLAHSQREQEEALFNQEKLEQEVTSLRDELKKSQEDCKTTETRADAEKRQNEARVRQLENEIQRLKERLRNMQEVQMHMDQQLQETEEERENLLAELEEWENKSKMDDARVQMQLLDLDKELTGLKKAMAGADKSAAHQLSAAKDQLKSLHATVHQLNRERAQELKVAKGFRVQAVRAARDLAKAEAEIDLLQNLLKDKEMQLQEETSRRDTDTTASATQQLEIDKLKRVLRRQRAETERLKHQLEHVREENTGNIEGLLDEIEALRNSLSHQNDYITSMVDPFRRRGYWYYVPSPPKAPSVESQSTRDSGLGSQHPFSASANRGPRRGRKDESEPPPSGGYWVYSPIRNKPRRSHSHRGGDDGGDSGAESDGSDVFRQPFVPPFGSVIYTVLPDGSPVPQGTVVYGPPPPPPANGTAVTPGTVIYGPPPPGVQVIYGPPPANFSVPLIPAGVLHCNVPEHHELDYKHFSLMRDFLEGRVNTLMSELELEKSLKRHDDITDEIECIEKTLLKRQAELREADRLLTEAETELQSTRAKTKDTIQRYTEAKRHFADTEKDAVELERRAQETAVKLVKVDQQLRLLQSDIRDLEQHKAEQEDILEEINRVVSSRDSEFQALSQKIERRTEKLEKLQTDIQIAESKEEQHLQTLKDAEALLQDKKEEIDRLTSEVAALQEELVVLNRHVGKKKEELQLLQDNIEQRKTSLTSVLREGEAEVVEKQRQIRETKSVLENLSAQKGELSAQISEKRAQHSLLKEEVMREEDILQNIVGQINKQKTELKHVLEMLQLENNELQNLKLQHDKKVNELERAQVAVLEEKVCLEKLQQTAQCQHGEAERHKKILEKVRAEKELLTGELHTLQDTVESLTKERAHLEENCHSLEKRLVQTKRALIDTEDNNRAVVSNLEKLESDMSVIKQEIAQLNSQKQTLSREISTTQQQLQEKKEELQILKDDFGDTESQLQLIEQDLKNAIKRRDELLSEQITLKEEIGRSRQKYQDCLEKEERKQHEIEQIQEKIEKKKQEIEEQEKFLQTIMENIECEEERLEQCTAQLKSQLQVIEAELAERQSKMEQVTAKVTTLEERARKLQQDENQCAALEGQLAEFRHQFSDQEQQLQEKTQEALFLQKETALLKSDLSHLQDLLVSERKKAEKKVSALKEEMKTYRVQLEKALNGQRYENSRLKKEVSSLERAAHESRDQAQHLVKELSQIKQEYSELTRQLSNQEVLGERQKEIKEAMRMLRSEVKAEISTGLKSKNQSKDLLEDLGSSSEERESLQRELESLKENFPFAANEGRPFEERVGFTKFYLEDEQWRGEALREKLRQHEDHLKAQLRQCMFKQAETLNKRKQQTEGTLHSLKKRVDALDELVSNTSADSSARSQNALGLTSSFHEDADRKRSWSFHGVLKSPKKTAGRRTQSRSSYFSDKETIVPEPDTGRKKAFQL
nr:PREDICTED: centriolin [Latimeria chalumnae]|eukprot:XP_014346159.1 PREDICTED: centriolin [Latimeria chalumnae]